jgi:hypothetical protein
MRLYLLSVLLLACLCAPLWAQSTPPQFTRAMLYQRLLAAKVIDPGRRLIHLSHTGYLHINGQWFPVADVEEMVKGAVEARGVKHIIVLSPSFKVLHRIEYHDERPLFCLENRLYVDGALAIPGVGPEGNVLTFTEYGREVSISSVEPNDFPVPLTRNRKPPIQ